MQFQTKQGDCSGNDRVVATLIIHNKIKMGKRLRHNIVALRIFQYKPVGVCKYFKACPNMKAPASTCAHCFTFNAANLKLENWFTALVQSAIP